MASTLEFEIALPDKNSGQLVNQLHRQLRAAIVSGRLSAGSQLPPTRKLASELGVSRNTIIAAYDLLLGEGYVNGKVGSGNYVTDAARPRLASGRTPSHNPISLIAPNWRRLPRPIPHPLPATIKYDFRFGHPDVKQFPHHIWQRLSARALRQAIRSGEAAGPPEASMSCVEPFAPHFVFPGPLPAGRTMSWSRMALNRDSPCSRKSSSGRAKPWSPWKILDIRPCGLHLPRLAQKSSRCRSTQGESSSPSCRETPTSSLSRLRTNHLSA